MELINWYKTRHLNYKGNNTPCQASLTYLNQLHTQILLPIQNKFGPITVTYGFTSLSLLSYIKKNSPGDMAPEVDQHASMELNTRGHRICKREGAACDFLVAGYETSMDEIAKYITQELPYDRLYFYGKYSPIHVSSGPDNSRYALIRKARSDGLRVNNKSTKGTATQSLFDDL